LKPAYEGVIAEPENVFFEVFQNPEKPGAFKFIENWNATPEWFLSVSYFQRLRIEAEVLTLQGSIEQGVLQAVLGGYRANVD
jgi:hypothetical protein